ncbi:sulfotransferase [Aphanothece hegewaldii CCALA 016]|uniref:Sulfotransferase n=1 Tax=Aphanothece hegewaldii CCALA 016 TaxID=2107694 RepID=A0A2T1LZG2_9CHRO|nr:sulfotransferase [Aphanothece hegewaldii]PSF37808.1 sulfotransferase [Aphanothece hegewaldii CCALA 016]
MLPNFLIIGATKSGTTSLYHYLKQHPQIYMSPIKEPRFFASPTENNSVNAPEIPWLKNNLNEWIQDLTSYQALFQNVKDEVAIGEASVMYLFSFFAPTRIKHHIPNVKLIAILRHPVERAYSNFLHAIRDGQETIQCFKLALDAEPERIQAGESPLFFYQYKGFYYRYLKKYFQLFDREQIQIHLYEDFQNHPQKTLSSIFQFLDVDSNFVPDTSTKYQVTGFPKNTSVQKLIRLSKPIRQAIRPLLPEKLRDYLYFSIQNNNLEKPQMSPEIRLQLIETYREDILSLQDLIQRDLSHWLK